MSGDDRPRRSWREIDSRRDGGRRADDAAPPRGRHAEARAKQATAAYVKELDKLFSDDAGGSEGEALARAIRETHGSSALPDACRAYLQKIGIPRDAALLALFLDSRDPELTLPAIEGLLALQREGRLMAGAGLRSQLRLLIDGPDAGIADAAEELREVLDG